MMTWMKRTVPRWVVIMMILWMAVITLIYGNALLAEVGENCMEQQEMENTTVLIFEEVFDFFHDPTSAEATSLDELREYLLAIHPYIDPQEECL